MNVLVLGTGGREHALAWKIAQSPLLGRLICAPGNPGMAQVGLLQPIEMLNPSAVVASSKKLGVDLVVVGPEGPLVAGVADALRDAGIAVFGPNQTAAALEGSKAFAKEVMAQAGVPTAEGKTFTHLDQAMAYARSLPRVVVKADGLAAGKGVVVAQSSDEAVAALRQLAQLGAAARTFVLEEVLEGEEISLIALCDGQRYLLLPPAQDHKRVGDGDSGANTGGMGAYVPAPFLREADLETVGRDVIAPVLRTMNARGTPFSGALYAGLMMTPSGPKVLEFNARMGDPETQVLMLQLAEDILPWLWACARGTLEPRPLKLHEGASVGVVLASQGYPESARVGDGIEGLEDVGSEVQVFHAGTRTEGGRTVSSGGRVLTVCARGPSLLAARDRAYQGLSRIRLKGAHFRRDIGAKALQP